MKIEINLTTEQLIQQLGNIIPCGETNIDEKRLARLEETGEIVLNLLDAIKAVANMNNCIEYSKQSAATMAQNILDEVEEIINE